MIKTMMEHLKENIDWPLVIIVTFLIIIGVIMVFSTTAMIGLTHYKDAYFFVKKHLAYLLIGLVMLWLGYKINHQIYEKYTWHLYILGVFMVALPLIPNIGIKVGGAKRWISFYFFQFQPVEVLKFSIAVFLAVSLVNKKNQLHQFKEGLFPILIVIAVPILILMNQPDLGNSILILIVMFLMLFIANMPLQFLGGLMVGGVGVLVASILTHPYQLQRIQSFFNPWNDPLGRNYHIIQSYTAIGSGGLIGHGFGQSKLKFFYLPLHYSDFVFSIICEEGGFILALIVLGLFTGLLYKGVRIGLDSSSEYSSYLGIGLTLCLVIQACLNIGVVIGVFPITGIPLTFISYGGSSFIMSMFFIGILLNIYRNPK